MGIEIAHKMFTVLYSRNILKEPDSFAFFVMHPWSVNLILRLVSLLL